MGRRLGKRLMARETKECDDLVQELVESITVAEDEDRWMFVSSRLMMFLSDAMQLSPEAYRMVDAYCARNR